MTALDMRDALSNANARTRAALGLVQEASDCACRLSRSLGDPMGAEAMRLLAESCCREIGEYLLAVSDVLSNVESGTAV